MLKYLKKFIENEAKGLRQIGNIYKEAIRQIEAIYWKSEIELEKTPLKAEQDIAMAISERAGVHPDSLKVTSETFNSCYAKKKSIYLSLELIEKGSAQRYVGVYAHELGHVKHSKLHAILSYSLIPTMVAMAATSSLYTIGLPMHYALDNDVVLNVANNVAMASTIPAAINCLSIAVREHMADIFAYNNTGLLPSSLLMEKRHGIIGNASKVLGEITGTIMGGYPPMIMRDLACKVFGKKPQDVSFVERLEAERQQRNIQSAEIS